MRILNIKNGYAWLTKFNGTVAKGVYLLTAYYMKLLLGGMGRLADWHLIDVYMLLRVPYLPDAIDTSWF